LRQVAQELQIGGTGPAREPRSSDYDHKTLVRWSLPAECEMKVAYAETCAANKPATMLRKCRACDNTPSRR
jgi:hypothetical protein